MRTIVGVIAVLSLAVTVAVAQPPRERGASFRPPEPLQPGELPVARGVADDFPPSSFLPSSTPVTRPNPPATRAATGPAWLSGTDPNVRPAAGNETKTGGVRTLTPPNAQPKDDPTIVQKGLDKLKGTPRPQPAPPEQPTAASPFRGTSANGAPVYAGPPAYRWYGWGTVTPGANQFAPTGQYPKASANWYSITGATPGAFPVPVMNPLRTPPGTEPPSYNTAARSTPPAPQSVVTVAAQPQPPFQPQPRPQPTERPEPPRFNPTGESKFIPAPGVGLAPPAHTTNLPAAPVNVPKLTPPPVTAPVVVAPPVMPDPVAVKEPAPIPLPKTEPVVVLPPIPVPLVEPTKPITVDAPSPLPTSVVEEPKPEEPKRVPEEPKRIETKPEAPKREEQWQPAPPSVQPAPGTWTPAGAPLPVQSNDATPAWKSGSAPVKSVVARAQMPDAESDPIATLIRQVCQGRAEGVDIRWSGTKKLMVCFEVRTSAEAQKLVTDISRRKELAPYQIDFCVVVK